MSAELEVRASSATDEADGRLPDAVLWDLDGTLIESEDAWAQAVDDIIARFGGEPLTPDADLVGSSMQDAVAMLIESGVDLTEDELHAALAHGVLERVKGSIVFRVGVLDLVASIAAAGIPQAIVTMSPRIVLDEVLALLPPGTFALTVAGDEVTLGKPHPEAYVAAATCLGTTPHRCVVLEDSSIGSRAARASGAPIIAVPMYGPIVGVDVAVTWDGYDGKTVADVIEVSRNALG